MSELDERPRIAEDGSFAYAVHRQGLHAAAAAALLVTAWWLTRERLDAGSFLGISTRAWFWTAAGGAVAHQVIVAVGFRAQLVYGTLTNALGTRALAMWGAVFLPLLVARPVLVLATGLADLGSLRLPAALAYAVATALALPALYGAYSVRRWFGIPRALGGDHFHERYRRMPFVREGAFRWSSNAMYAIVFLGLWSIALYTRSYAALIVAAFQHACIWVHYGCTEKPDMERLYAPEAGASAVA